MKSKFLALSLFLLLGAHGYLQVSNNDPKVGVININLPKTPESQAFEKYGNIAVSEFSGSPNIAVPIYSLKSRFLEVPISLSYNASGIRVSQEASWVGLGFDLIAGGRITVETRGCVDNDGLTPNLFPAATLKAGLNKLFGRLGNSSTHAILTYAGTCRDCDTVANPVLDNWASINAMAQYGLGEPDIFRASFMGQSLSFYFDKITEEIKFLGEKSHFNIAANKDSYGKINDWTITDNSGNKYYFTQKENTSMSMPPMGALANPSSTTAWLLTKVQHPTGDEINFTYTGYGNTYPANSKSSSVSFNNAIPNPTYSNDYNQNVVTQTPLYLTKIESNDVAVEFILGSRIDLKGAGSKRLDEIWIRDKQANTVKKKVLFGYDYFSGSLESCYNALTQAEKDYYRLRLKLNTLTFNDAVSQPPYQFFYYNGAVPSKYSNAQDHWGYLNIGGSASCEPKELIPGLGLGNDYIYTSNINITKNRDCYPAALPSMTLDSIIYPTGGSTKFIYEPHYSIKAYPRITPLNVVNGVTNVAIEFNIGNITGGGLRVRTVRNYSLGKLAGTNDYEYYNGYYMGEIRYNTSSYKMSYCGDSGDGFMDVLSNNGAVNDNDFLVGYGAVIARQTGENGQQNGYIKKAFNITVPFYAGNGLGYDVMPAHWPVGPAHSSSLITLAPPYSGFAPTPTIGLDGKLDTEEYFDNQGIMVKSVKYNYSLADYSQKLYSVKVKDNRIGGADASGGCSGGGPEFATNGARRFTIFASPAKSYYTLTESVEEKTYQGSSYITQKKAYKYNKYYQPEYESVFNSDGTQTITYTKTSRSLEPLYPIAPSGDATMLSNTKAAHIYDLPLEQTVIKRTAAGDSLVVQSRFNLYSGPLPVRSYNLETSRPLAFRSQFVPAFFNYPNYPNAPSGSNYTLKMDDKYKLYTTALYSTVEHVPSGLVKEIQGLQGNSSYVWDEYGNDLLASCTNSVSSDIAYTSFETASFAGWTLNVAGIAVDNTAPTGTKSYSLPAGSITRSGFSATSTYTVSYWGKSGSKLVNGTSAAVTGTVLNGWTYYEHKLVNPAGGSITLSGSGSIDELRIYPVGALMTTYTYETVTGLTHQCDAANRITYYEYDAIGRLARIRDSRRNILKQFEYKYQQAFSYPYGNQFKSQLFTKSCPTGYAAPTVSYSVPAGRYGSFLSVADADAKADNEILQNGQALANTGECTPFYQFTGCCGTGYGANSFNLTGTGSVNFSLTIYQSSGYGQIGTLTGPLFLPSAARYVSVSAGGNTWTLVFYTSGQVNIMGPAISGAAVTLSGTYAL